MQAQENPLINIIDDFLDKICFIVVKSDESYQFKISNKSYSDFEAFVVENNLIKLNLNTNSYPDDFHIQVPIEMR